MYNNMTGPVGFAMHEDRLARAAKSMQLAEAEYMRRRPGAAVGSFGRDAIARVLMTLAARLATKTEIVIAAE